MRLGLPENWFAPVGAVGAAGTQARVGARQANGPATTAPTAR